LIPEYFKFPTKVIAADGASSSKVKLVGVNGRDRVGFLNSVNIGGSILIMLLLVGAGSFGWFLSLLFLPIPNCC
jgi:hypothetical protein